MSGIKEHMADSVNMDDKYLVSEIRKDNMQAFEKLFNLYKKKLYYFVLGYLKENQDTEEVVQSIFVNIWEHRKNLDSSLSIKSYIYKSAVNSIYNYLKKKAVRKQYIDNELLTAELFHDDTHDSIYYQELKERLENILGSFPHQQKTIFFLSRNEGLSHKEIAEKLNISVRTVENQIYRALKMIRENLRSDMFFLLCFLFF